MKKQSGLKRPNPINKTRGDQKEMLELMSTIGNDHNHQYSVYKMMYEGRYGNIYKGLSKQTNDLVVIKTNTEQILSEREYLLYQILWNHKSNLSSVHSTLNIPKIYWYGFDQGEYLLIMERLGNSLDLLYDRYSKSFSRKTIYWIIKECLTLLRDLHDVGILHRDIKPDNFALGYYNSSALYIFDFGLAGQYLQEHGQHWIQQSGLQLIGTSRYASINNHLGLTQSRRDDIESLWYMMIYLTYGWLPWLMIDTGEILHCKQTYDWTSKISKHYITWFNEIRSLEFAERPDYEKWIALYINKYEKHKGELNWIYPVVTITERKTFKTFKTFKNTNDV